MQENPNIEAKCSGQGTKIINPEDPDGTFDSGSSDDESEIEQDVKVCDICGDAGHEDLLAICSKCSDGAEHTYCMRKMMENIPEGDWICEECERNEQLSHGDNDSEGIENGKSSGLSMSGVMDAQDSEVEVNKTNMVNLSSQVASEKDHNNSKTVPAPKNEMIKANIGSPTSNSEKVKSSTRGSDKGPREPARQASLKQPTDDVHDVASSAVSQTTKRTLSNSSSFDTSSQSKVVSCDEASPSSYKGTEEATTDMKDGHARVIGKSLSMSMQPKRTLSNSSSFDNSSQPKVVPCDESLPPSYKGTAEAATDVQDGHARVIRKSLSKSMQPKRTTNSEGKVKFLPSVPHGQDLQGFRSVKYRNTLGRSNSLRLERPAISAALTSKAKNDDILPSREPSLRSNQDGKRLRTAKTSRSSSSSGSMDVEQISAQSNFCTEHVSGSTPTSDRASTSSNGNHQNGLAKSSDSICRSEKARNDRNLSTKEGNCMRGKSPPSPNNNELCSPRNLLNDVKESEKVVKGSNLRAAIEAAMLKKPGICRKNKIPDQMGNQASKRNPNCEAPSRESTDTRRRLQSRENVLNRAAEFNKPSNTLKNPFTRKNEISSGVRNLCSSYPNIEKFTSQELPAHASLLDTGFLDMLVIPEQKYIWQGGFEVHKNYKQPDFCTGIQAHLSTRASPKVAEVVSKFSSKVPLNEIPRLTAWPTQFHNTGVKDENIALYFFAKDFESYENYKCLLDTMMKNDLALKGMFDEIELLIFPSSQLPEKSQRWNMLFFLWGVFKGKRPKCHSQIPEPSHVVHNPVLNYSQVGGRPVVTCDIEGTGVSANLDNNPTFFEKLASGGVSVSREEPSGTSSDFSRDGGGKACPPQSEEVNLKGNSNNQDYNLDSHLRSGISTGSAVICAKTGTIFSPDESRENQVELKNNCPSSPRTQTSPANKGAPSSPERVLQSKERTPPPPEIMNLPCGNNDNVPANEQTRNKKHKTDSGGMTGAEISEKHLFPLDRFMSGEGSKKKRAGGDSFPDLELALGAERKPAKQERLAFFSGNNRVGPAGPTKEDEGSASLSLSLSFPFEDRPKPATRHGNTPLLLFGAFPDR